MAHSSNHQSGTRLPPRSDAARYQFPRGPSRGSGTIASAIRLEGEEATSDVFLSLWNAVSLLPEDQRTVVNLFYVEELSTQEIARILECTAGAVRTRLYRARSTLRGLLREPEKDPPSHQTANPFFPHAEKEIKP